LEDACVFTCLFARLCILHNVILIVIKLYTSFTRRAAAGILISREAKF